MSKNFLNNAVGFVFMAAVIAAAVYIFVTYVL